MCSKIVMVNIKIFMKKTKQCSMSRSSEGQGHMTMDHSEVFSKRTLCESMHKICSQIKSSGQYLSFLGTTVTTTVTIMQTTPR